MSRREMTTEGIIAWIEDLERMSKLEAAGHFKPVALFAPDGAIEISFTRASELQLLRTMTRVAELAVELGCYGLV